MSVRLKYLGLGSGAALSMLSGPALAQSSGPPVMTINTITSSAPNLGTVIVPTDTTFTVEPSAGGVTVTGTGMQIHTAGNATATVTVKCGNQTLCGTTKANIYISNVGSPTNRAQALTNFKVSMGSTVLASGSSLGPGNPLTFTINPIGVSGTQTFNVGMDFPISGDESGLTSGTSTSNFQVLIAPAPTAGSSGTGKTATGATVKVFHALSISHNNGDDLMFGSIVPAKSGNASIKVDPNTGALTTGNALALAGTPRTALFTIIGEGTERFTIALPTPITLTSMSDPTQTLSLNLQASATSSHTMDGTLGTPSTYAYTVGGFFTLPAAQKPGVYKGTMVVTIQYP
jgi:hypothetical protein